MKPTKINLALLFLLLFNFVMFRAQSFLTIVYIIQKVLFFGLMAVLSYIIIDYFTKKLLDRKLSEKKFNTIIIFRTAIFGLSLVLIVGMQLLYINKRETLYIDSCEYYDLYNNLVYKSQLNEVCPELEVITQNEDEFVFREVQEVYGTKYYSGLYTQFIFEINDAEYAKIKLLSDIYVKYDDEFNVVEYDIRLSEYIEYKQDDEIVYVIYSYHRNVLNEYSNDNFETSVKEAYIVEYNTVDYNDDVEHYEFISDDYELYRIYKNYVDLYAGLEIDYNIIKETLLDDGSYEEEVLGEVERDSSRTRIYIDLDTDNNDSITYIRFLHLDENYVSVKKYSVSSSDTYSWYSFEYKKEDDNVFYLYRNDYYNNNLYNYVIYEDSISGKTFMTNRDDRVFEFVETEYGMKVIEKRIKNFDYFRSNDSQLEERRLLFMYDEYKYIHSYEYNLFKNPHSPQVILRGMNPLID